MQVKCEYCGSLISDTEAKCPNCGAVNEHMARSAAGVPKTIEELKAYCAENQFPLEKMRFYIGEDYKGPKAFGIYKKDSVCVVYKNKSDGSRAVRYEGTDEAYAVNELFQKIKEESLKQIEEGNLQRKQCNEMPPQHMAGQDRKKSSKNRSLITGIVIAVLLINFLPMMLTPLFFLFSGFKGFGGSSGEYYQSEDVFYYNNGDDWYYYDADDNDWYDIGTQYFDEEDRCSYSEFTEAYGSENAYSGYDDGGWDNFWDSSSDDFWDSSWDDDWDSGWDSDYDYGGWDSGSSDWDSDW